jgi:hypothetical protein
MNERIKKLYTEASEWALHNYPPPVNLFEWEDLRSKKFAELIVRECSAKAWFAEQYDMGDGVPISKQIKEHFGVKE